MRSLRKRMSWEAVHNAISLPPARCAKAEWIFIAFRHFHHFRGPHTKIVVLPLTAVCHLLPPSAIQRRSASFFCAVLPDLLPDAILSPDMPPVSTTRAVAKSTDSTSLPVAKREPTRNSSGCAVSPFLHAAKMTSAGLNL